ncbi:hypothetical protein SJAG_05920 [Schizosaccharomyces japonicus yFS275]|uniref:Uncharacterized protein n=1 Tax=Schizosaccharomyces japonicus (strain yFS275 / FY16936) TaxID=402676 RepID=T0T6J2_SCHJY|nr:hypothetical protein SJAG_05920 [Schizosaccharomyces japonicus yFS275]EQC53049.1 hypothetical protein SJAG_05920 [Schizosaccharomyces japonicus yFS275]
MKNEQVPLSPNSKAALLEQQQQLMWLAFQNMQKQGGVSSPFAFNDALMSMYSNTASPATQSPVYSAVTPTLSAPFQSVPSVSSSATKVPHRDLDVGSSPRVKQCLPKQEKHVEKHSSSEPIAQPADFTEEESQNIARLSAEIEQLETEKKYLLAETDEKIKTYQREMKSLQLEQMEIQQEKRTAETEISKLEKEVQWFEGKINAQKDQHSQCKKEQEYIETAMSYTNKLSLLSSSIPANSPHAKKSHDWYQNKVEEYEQMTKVEAQAQLPLFQLVTAILNPFKDSNDLVKCLYPTYILNHSKAEFTEPITLNPRELECIAFHVKAQSQMLQAQQEEIVRLTEFMASMQNKQPEVHEKAVVLRKNMSEYLQFLQDSTDKLKVTHSSLSTIIDNKEQMIQKLSKDAERESALLSRKADIKPDRYRNVLRDSHSNHNRSFSPVQSHAKPSADRGKRSSSVGLSDKSYSEVAVLRYLTQVESFAKDERVFGVLQSRYLKLTNRPLCSWDYTTPISGKPVETKATMASHPRNVEFVFLHVTLRDTNNILWLTELWCDGIVRGFGHAVKKNDAAQKAAEMAAEYYKGTNWTHLLNMGMSRSAVLPDLFFGRVPFQSNFPSNGITRK